MGQKNLRSKESYLMDKFLLEAFDNIDLTFHHSDITKMKIRFKDAENYFGIKFNYFIFFNNYLFHKQLPKVYNNYMKKVEDFSKELENNKNNYIVDNKKVIKNSDKEIFYVFVDFDDETDAVDEGYDFEFDSLFSIIFEKLEIDNLTCFSFVNCETKSYIYLFINQFYESIYLHKTNRRFDALYFLLPNTDFFIKNENYVIYIGNKSKELKKNENDFSPLFFTSLYFKELVNISYPFSKSNNKIYDFLGGLNYSPSFINLAFYLNLYYNDIMHFYDDYSRFINIHNEISNKCDIIYLYCYLEPLKNIDSNSNFECLFKKIIINNEKSKFKNSKLVIKILNLVYILKNTDRRKSDLYVNYSSLKSRNLFTKYYKFDLKDKDEQNLVSLTTKNLSKSKKKNNLLQLDKLIHMMLNLSFSNIREKKKDLLIEYIEINNIFKPSPNNSIKNKFVRFASDFNEPVFFTNNLEDDGAESNELKAKTIYKYSKETLIYHYFISNNEILKIKINIIGSINKFKNGFNFSKNNNLKENHDIKNFYKYLFEFLFSNKNRYFYCKWKNSSDLSSNQVEFEKNFFFN